MIRATRGTRCAGGLLLLAAFELTGPAFAERSVLVMFDPRSPTHDQVFVALRNSLLDQAPGQPPLRVRRQGIADPPLPLPPPRPDLVVTIGVDAAARLQEQAPAAPVLNLLLPRAAYIALHAGQPAPPAAVFIDQPVARQFALARALLPDLRRAGILHDVPHDASTQDCTAAARRFDFELEIVTLAAANDPPEAIQALLERSELVIATFDREVYRPATTKWLLYLAYQQQRPIIGFSRALLEAGAVASVYSRPTQIAAHAADLVREWLRSGDPPEGADYPRYFDVGLNDKASRRLGLLPPPPGELDRRVRELLGTRG